MLNNISLMSGKVHFLGLGKKEKEKKSTFDPDVSREIAGKFAKALSGYRDDTLPVITNREMRYVHAALCGKGGINHDDDTLISLGNLRDAVGDYCTLDERVDNKMYSVDSVESVIDSFSLLSNSSNILPFRKK
jgi:hypothetical protein